MKVNRYVSSVGTQR